MGSWLYAGITVLMVMLFAMTEGEPYIIPVRLKLITIEDGAPLEALAVVVVVCSWILSLISGKA